MNAPAADPCAPVLAKLRMVAKGRVGLAVGQREELLDRLASGVVAMKASIVRAADADFGGRIAEETLFGEILGAVSLLRYSRRHLASWAKPRPVPVGLPFWPARAWIVPQPLGVVGIMSPWNYPLLLAIAPLAGALAAGNRVMLKPSEHAPRVAELIAQLVDDKLGSTVAQVMLGGPEVARAFARQRFDHLIFTGSTARGREVALAAAANLVPVTLELGGKCPAIVLPDADLDDAARAIITGKGLNAGQTCIAPDHVLLAGLTAAQFVPHLERAVQRHFPAGLTTRIAPHAMLRPEFHDWGHDQLGIIIDPPEESPLVQEEIFGPVLPVHQLPDLQSVIQRLQQRDPPLAVYLFGRDRQAEKRVLCEVAAGALVVGGTVLHAAMEALPFGGLGTSGMGRYRGKAGFDALSNMKSHVRAGRFSLFRLAEPPYGVVARRVLAHLLPDSG